MNTIDIHYGYRTDTGTRIPFSLRKELKNAVGIDLSLLKHVSPIEWDNVVLYGQYILDRKLVRRRPKRVVLSV
jgi:hypothetical protein